MNIVFLCKKIIIGLHHYNMLGYIYFVVWKWVS